MGALCHTYIPYMYPSYTPYASRTPYLHLTYLSPSTLSLMYIPHTYALLPSGPGSTHGRLVIQSSLKCIPHIRVSPPLQVLGAHMGAAGYTGILQMM